MLQLSICLSLNSTFLAHPAGAYPAWFPYSMKRLEVLLLLLSGWDASLSQDYPPAFHQASLTLSPEPIYTPERHCESNAFCQRIQQNDPTKSFSKPGPLYPSLVHSPVRYLVFHDTTIRLLP